MRTLEIDVTHLVYIELIKMGYNHSDALEFIERPLIFGADIMEHEVGGISPYKIYGYKKVEE